MSLLVFVGAILTGEIRGQITNISLSSDSSFVLDRVYAGVLGANDFSIDSVYRTGFVGFRVGASAKLRVTKAVSLVSFIAEDVTNAGNSIGGTGFFVKLAPSPNFYIAVGQGPQVSTFLHRAHPASAGGQFETFTHRSIPGAAPGLRLVKTVGKTNLLGSIAVVDGVPQYQVGVSFASVAVSAWRRADSLWGTAVTYQSKRTKTIVVVRDDLVASTFTLNLPNKYILYTDAGITTGDRRVVRAEAGFLRTFEADKYVKGLFGLGYANELRSVRGYIFVTL